MKCMLNHEFRRHQLQPFVANCCASYVRLFEVLEVTLEGII